jgi:hypothetical protein
MTGKEESSRGQGRESLPPPLHYWALDPSCASIEESGHVEGPIIIWPARPHHLPPAITLPLTLSSYRSLSPAAFGKLFLSLATCVSFTDCELVHLRTGPTLHSGRRLLLSFGKGYATYPENRFLVFSNATGAVSWLRSFIFIALNILSLLFFFFFFFFFNTVTLKAQKFLKVTGKDFLIYG